MHYSKLIFLSLFSFIILHAENSVGLNINSEDLEIQASTNLFSSYEGSTTFVLDGSYLHTDGDNMTTIGFSGENTFQSMDGLSLAFGAKVVLADSFMTLPLFAKANLVLPFNDSIPTTSLITSFAYAPSVLSFVDAESYTEFRFEADMEIVSNIHLFTGYRNIDTEYNIGTKKFNDSFYGGMKLSF
jgi:hypothetical protein